MKNVRERIALIFTQEIRILERIEELGSNKSKYLFFDPTSKTDSLNAKEHRNAIDKCDTKENNEKALKEAEISLI